MRGRAARAAVLATLLYPFAAGAASIGWVYSSDVDPMTDLRRAYVIAHTDHNADAAFSCHSDGTAFFVADGSRLDFSLDSARTVAVRFDNLPPINMVWRSSSKGGVIIIGKDALAMAWAIANAHERIVIDTGNGGPAVYSVAGAAIGVQQALGTCGIPYGPPK